MPLPTRPPANPNNPGADERAYGYHVYDYPGSQPMVAVKTYDEAAVAAWLATFPLVAGKGAEFHPYGEEAYAGFPSRKKLRVCRTLGSNNSTRTGYERYSLAKDMEELRAEAATQGLHPALGYFESYFRRKIYTLVFGSHTAGHPQILLTGGIHGREWISVEIPFLIAEYLIKNYDQDDDIQDLLDNCQLWVIPMLNPDGHAWSAVKTRLWRKNRKKYQLQDLTAAAGAVYSEVNHKLRITFADASTKDVERRTFIGVDCNRNFRWGADRQRDPTRETFAGPAAGSELEKQALDRCRGVGGNLTFAPAVAAAPQLTQLAGAIDYHSAKGAILFHDDVDEQLVVGAAPVQARMREVIKATRCMQKHIADYGDGSPYRRGTTQAIVGEESTGSVMDYCYQVMNQANRLPLAFTIELDPVGDDQGRDRWSLDKAAIQKVFEKNLSAALCLIQHARAAHAPPIPAPVGPVGAVVAPPACPINNWPGRVRDRGNQPPAAAGG